MRARFAVVARGPVLCRVRYTQPGRDHTRIDGARVAIVANGSDPGQTGAAVAGVADRAGVAVAARCAGGQRRRLAAASRRARVGRAGVAVVADHRQAGLAVRIIASVPVGAGVPVTAARRVREVDTAAGRLAGVVAAQVVIVALRHAATHAHTANTAVRIGAGVGVVAGAGVCRRDAARRWVAAVVGARVAIAAVFHHRAARAVDAVISLAAGVAVVAEDVGAQRCRGTASGVGHACVRGTGVQVVADGRGARQARGVLAGVADRARAAIVAGGVGRLVRAGQVSVGRRAAVEGARVGVIAGVLVRCTVAVVVHAVARFNGRVIRLARPAGCRPGPVVAVARGALASCRARATVTTRAGRGSVVGGSAVRSLAVAIVAIVGIVGIVGRAIGAGLDVAARAVGCVRERAAVVRCGVVTASDEAEKQGKDPNHGNASTVRDHLGLLGDAARGQRDLRAIRPPLEGPCPACGRRHDATIARRPTGHQERRLQAGKGALRPLRSPAKPALCSPRATSRTNSTAGPPSIERCPVRRCWQAAQCVSTAPWVSPAVGGAPCSHRPAATARAARLLLPPVASPRARTSLRHQGPS